MLLHNNLPKLSDIKWAQFRKSSRKLFYKRELEDSDFMEACILKPKFKIEMPQSASSARGINAKKRHVILKELVPHMPSRKQMFWKNLPISSADDCLEDLVTTSTEI